MITTVIILTCLTFAAGYASGVAIERDRYARPAVVVTLPRALAIPTAWRRRK